MFSHVSMAVFEGVGAGIIHISSRFSDLDRKSKFLDSISGPKNSVEIPGNLLHSRTLLPIDSDDQSSCLECRRCRAWFCKRCGGLRKDPNLVHRRHGHHHCFYRLGLGRFAGDR